MSRKKFRVEKKSDSKKNYELKKIHSRKKLSFEKNSDSEKIMS